MAGHSLTSAADKAAADKAAADKAAADKAAADKAAADKAAADKAAADRQQSSKIITDDTERRRKILLNEINSIDNRTNAVADNGLLFDRKGKQDYLEDIQNNLKVAREKLYAGDLVDSEYYTSLALRLYDKALYSTSRIWRFSNVHAGPMWIYLVGFLVAVLAFY
jgi:membrane protein involved in colicin uptake